MLSLNGKPLSFSISRRHTLIFFKMHNLKIKIIKVVLPSQVHIWGNSTYPQICIDQPDRLVSILHRCYYIHLVWPIFKKSIFSKSYLCDVTVLPQMQKKKKFRTMQNSSRKASISSVKVKGLIRIKQRTKLRS